MTQSAPGTPLDKTFDPASIEAKWYAHWESQGLFRPHRPHAEPFTIVNPPPNVTGSLHIGHALDNTLQDVVVRYERLRGKDALWVVGTDHAGIATQMVVERELEKNQDKRANYTREAFIDKVWEWKAESGGTITGQLRRLGCSMDWSREQFTMDPHFTKAVTKVFVDLYNEGLIYRDKRLVNWDPKLKTAISDLEVETREIQGHFWHFRYPLADGAKTASGASYIVVATTRPETMLADMRVAVSADDPRYQSLVTAGAKVLLPITGREIAIIFDEHADPELGSGVVKITPGHDFNDFEVGKRAGIKAGDMLNMFDAEARVVQTTDGLVPAEFIGLDRFEARKLVIQRMAEAGFLIPHVDKDGIEHQAEPRTIQTPYGDRGGVVIEPWLTDQWYVNAEELAKAPLDAVRSGAIEIVPKTWEKTFFNWMENIQPWCVSRQLWWGHRIPAWYGPTKQQDGTLLQDVHRPDGEVVFIAETEAEALQLAEDYYDNGWPVKVSSLSHWTSGGIQPVIELDSRKVVTLNRDNDVLDTWFSSALWPFATLGWPEDVPPRSGAAQSLLARHYPNNLLISGFDILFFWDARMAMMGLKLMGAAPWSRLYLHGLVRAADGQKMSKSKGNVVDPLVLIDKFGADALRFFMAAMESQGRDVKMDEKRVEGYRNFATKLWNAARFCQANGIGASTTLAAPAAKLAVNRWIIGEVVDTLALLDQAMADLRFDAAANAIYHFVWDQFCDWYVELIKGTIDDETRIVAGWVLDQILVMLHPFMPFVTEELWGALGDRAAYPLITAKWPEPGVLPDPEAKREVDTIIAIVSGIRAQRAEIGIPPSTILMTGVLHDEDGMLPVVNRWRDTLIRMARIRPGSIERTQHDKFVLRMDSAADSFELQEKFDTTSFTAMQFPLGSLTFVSAVDGVVDLAAEKARLSKALDASTKEAKSLEGRLNNLAFIEKAKPEAVDKARSDHALHQAEAERLAAALARLG